MPQPTTTGGGLMGYPTTVDTGAIAPVALMTDATEINSGAFTALTAGVAYLAPVTLYSPLTITGMRCQLSGAPTGNVDMGIYDATGTNGTPGNLLGHTGAIAAATGVFGQNLTANLALSPGRYWLAWLDTVADTVYRTTTSNTNAAPLVRSTSAALTVLPNSLSAATQNTTNKISLMALVSGGFV